MSRASASRIVVVGATSVIAAHTARRWAAAGVASLHLIGRDPLRLESVAEDLRVRAPSVEVTVAALDLTDPAAIAAEIVDAVVRRSPDTVLIAHGNMHEQQEMERDLRLAEDQLRVGGVSPVLWLEGFADAMPGGTIAVIGSPAGDRGRAKNYLYGAAKAMIERAAQGLQHRSARRGGPRIVLVKPGPTRTAMTAGMDGRRMAEPGDVAAGIVAAVAAGRPVAYVPGAWRWIMLVVRSLPRAVFHRTDF